MGEVDLKRLTDRAELAIDIMAIAVGPDPAAAKGLEDTGERGQWPPLASADDLRS